MSYLSFSKKERTGIVVLMSLILSIWLLPEFFAKPEAIPSEVKAGADSFVNKVVAGKGVEPGRTFHLFSFDPNTISDADWEELGLTKKTISIIRNYLSKGGRFREPDDIKRIYGLRTEDAERLVPYVRIAGRDKKTHPFYPKRPVKHDTIYSRAYTAQPHAKPSFRKEHVTVDINTADSIEWEALPGIGIKLAARIIKFREALGGFNSVDQVREVYGIDDSLFSRIKVALQLSSGIYRKVRINYWEADSLDMHPYIQKHEAKAIVKYRSQHGLFNEAEDLGKINLLSREWIERLKPYIILE